LRRCGQNFSDEIGARGRANSARERRTERAIHTAAAKALQDELPKWLAPHLEQLTRDVTVDFESRRGATRTAGRACGRNYGASEPALPRGEEVARRIVAQSQEIERRIGEHASVASAVLETQARLQEEAFGAHHERLNVTAGAAQQQLTDTAKVRQGRCRRI